MLSTAYYFLQVLLCSAIMMGYYWVVLRNKRFHQYNRFYLLAVAVLSWIVPLIKIQWSNAFAEGEQVERKKLMEKKEQKVDSEELPDKKNDVSPTVHYPLPTKIIALLPGSRKQEIAKKLPIMLSVAAHFPDHQFIIAKAPGLEDDFYTSFVATAPNISSVRNQTYDLLMKSDAALVTSGTATLETALFGVPEVVCYKGNTISYQIAKKLINIKYISLVNLIMDKPIVKELIQHELTTHNLIKELNLIIHDTTHRQKIINDYTALKQVLSEGGNASEQAAKKIVAMLY